MERKEEGARIEQEARERRAMEVAEKNNILWLISKLHIIKSFAVVDGKVEWEK